MRENYKRLGDYIREVKVKNRDGRLTAPLGISIDKFFMPSVANIVGTDLTNYKIVRKGQFACNRMHVGRDERIPVALSDRQDFIISPAYDVFEINNDALLPEFLMLWFKRKDFDRNAWFYTDSDVRGGLKWSAFCEIPIYVPTVEKQREIVEEYQTIENRIKINNTLCQKLEETAQAIYKHWFEDFEFPDENGKPYKSSGGKMVYNNELGKEIPEGWKVGRIEDVAEKLYGYPFNSNLFNSLGEGLQLVRIRDLLVSQSKVYTAENVDKKYIIKENDLLIGMDGIFHVCIWKGENALMNQRIVRLRPYDSLYFSSFHLLLSIKSQIKYLETNIQGTTVAHLSDKDLKELKVLTGELHIQSLFSATTIEIGKKILLINNANSKLSEMRNLLYCKTAVMY